MLTRESRIMRSAYDHSQYYINSGINLIFKSGKCIKLTSYYSFLWLYIDGSRSLQDLIDDSDLGEDICNGVVEGLIEQGLVKIVKE